MALALGIVTGSCQTQLGTFQQQNNLRRVGGIHEVGGVWGEGSAEGQKLASPCPSGDLLLPAWPPATSPGLQRGWAPAKKAAFVLP